MKKAIKLLALVISLVMLIEAFPIQAIDSITDDTEEAVEITTEYTDETEFEETSDEVITEDETIQDEPDEITEEANPDVTETEQETEVVTEAETEEEIEPEKGTENEYDGLNYDNTGALDLDGIREEEEEADVLGEIPDERRPDGKVFRMSDGTYASVGYPVAVHYEDEEGEYIQIDNSPEDGAFEGDEVIDAVKDNVFDAAFLKESKEDKLFVLTYGEDNVRVSLDGAENVQIRNATVKADAGKFDVPNIAGTYIYEDILENTDVKYTVVSTLIKENVILKDNVESDNLTYTYKTDGALRLVINEEGKIEIYDAAEEKTEAEISAPLMWDSAGEFGTPNLELEKINDNEYKVVVSWDAEWANDEERVYPITVDPVIETAVSFSDAVSVIDDAFAREASYDGTANWETLRVGRTNATGRVRSVIKVNLEDYVPKNANIINAGLYLTPFIYSYGYQTPVVNDFANEPYINMFRVTQPWSESTFCWNTLWSTNSGYGYSSNKDDYVRIQNFDPATATEIPIYRWDITRLANGWINGDYDNCGVMLAYANESEANGSMFFASSDWVYAEGFISAYARPRAIFQYLNTTGTESYYSAHSVSAGRAGTAYVNDMTGNLTAVNNLVSIGAGPAPIDLSIVYNSNNSDETYARPLGKGWKFNYCQTINLTDITSNGKRYFSYYDADGTLHYFLENTANGMNATDEIYPKRKITYNSSNYEFTMSAEDSEVKYYFKRKSSTSNTWYLDRIVDDYNNKLTFSYDSSSVEVLTKIVSTDGYTVNLNYNSNKFLTSISYTDSVSTKIISISYYTGNEYGSAITGITYEDGKTVHYSYASGTHRLNKMTDIDGYAIEFTYTGGSGITPLRVSGVTEKGTNGAIGQQMSMSYGFRSMTLNDITNGRNYLYTFNTTGTLKSVVDVTAGNNDGVYGEYYEFNNGSSGQLNKGNLTFASQTQKSTVNLITNHSFENSGNTFSGFQKSNNNNSSSTYSYSTAKYHTGAKSLSITKDGNCTAALIYYEKYLIEGKQYTFSAYVNTYGMTETSTGGVYLRAYCPSASFSATSEYLGTKTGSNDWKRIFITFTAEGSYHTFSLAIAGTTGTVYFDDVQLEEGGLSEYNLLENAGFEYASGGWTYHNTSSRQSSGGFDGACGKIAGAPAVRTHIYQTLNISGQQGDTYVGSALVKAYSVPEKTIDQMTHSEVTHCDYAMLVRFYNGSDIVNTAWIKFNPATAEWQKAAGQAIAGGTYTKIIVFLLYYNSANDAYFDNVTLVKDYFGNTYNYDSKGNLVSTKDLANSEENTFTYNGNSHLIKQTNISGSQIEYTYNSVYKHQLDSVLASGITTTFTYDGHGNAINALSKNSDGTKKTSSGVTYNDRGDMMATTDSHGNTTYYQYKEGLVDKVVDASGAKVKYNYNTSHLPTKSTFAKGSTSAEVSYGYDSNNYLTSLTSPDGTVYGFTYDEFGRKTSTAVGNIILSSNIYDGKGLLTGTTYGNGTTKTLDYDNLNRLKSESTNGTVRAKYAYDGKGRISETEDFLAGKTIKNEYDLLDRIVEARTINNSTNQVEQSSKVRYDNKNRVSGVDYTYLGSTKSTDYVYGTGSQEPSVVYGLKRNGTNVLGYTYDDLLRLTGKTITGANSFTTEYSYAIGKSVYDSGFASSLYQGRCVSGDFNGDGYDDLAAMYYYSSTHCKIFVWLADGTGGYQNYTAAYEANNYDAAKVTGRMCTGDYDGDGKDEIAAFYDLGNNHIELHVFKYNGGTFTKTVPYSETQSTFMASSITNRVTSGDYDGDGKDEIAVLYGYTNNRTRALVFKYTTNSNTAMAFSSWYDSGAGNFTPENITGRVASGDFDGDGKDEIATIYDNGSSSISIKVFNKNGSASQFTLETWYTSTTGAFTAGSATGTVVSGNFVGDTKDDLALIYKYPNYANVLTLKSTGSQFNSWTTKHIGNGNYTFEGMQYRVFGADTNGSGYDEIVAMYRQAARAFSIYRFEDVSETYYDLNSAVWNSQTAVSSSSTATTARISSETIGADTYTYTYDVLGNVTEIKKNGQAYRSYEYDALGELIRENNVDVGATYVYTYDNGGNILSKAEYAYTTGTLPATAVDTVNYGYSTGAWKDLLTSYDGEAITYDAIGNPTTYYTGDTFTWTDGRKLSAIQGTATFSYNADGIRTKKIADGVTHEYFLDGSKIICEKRSDGITLHFGYDENGNIFSLEYNGSTFYYVRNILGEIIGLIDTSGEYVVKYTYDAWGYPEDICDGEDVGVWGAPSHLANLNPFRYKGYYYDVETGFYYLQTRYYDPELSRFVNADKKVSTGQGFIGYNMFAYCNNNPVIFADYSGEDAILVVDYHFGEGLPIVGHIYLLFQDEDQKWWRTEFAGNLSKQYINLFSIDSDLTKYSSIINSEKDYDTSFWIDYVRLKGDYSYCKVPAQEFQKEVKNGIKKYDLIVNNCLNYVFEILSSTEGINLGKIIAISAITVVPAKAIQHAIKCKTMLKSVEKQLFGISNKGEKSKCNIGKKHGGETR